MAQWQVGHSDDDAYETAGNSAFSSVGTTIDMNASFFAFLRGNGGFRFTNITIANAATILTASLELYLVDASFDDALADIYAEDVDDAVSFVTDADVTNRVPTTASAPWVQDSLGTGWVTSPDFASVIKEIVDRGSWASGNDIVILVKGRATASKLFRTNAFDGTAGNAAKLNITVAAAARRIFNTT